jgi:hypothetical protein
MPGGVIGSRRAPVVRALGPLQPSPTTVCVILRFRSNWILRKDWQHVFREKVKSSAKQTSAARRNVKKAVSAAKSKQTISHLSKARTQDTGLMCAANPNEPPPDATVRIG